MASEAQKRATAKYDAANTVQIKIKLNTGTDTDIISALENEKNKQGYIKELIRKDIRVKEEIKRRVIALEFEGKISHEQGYRLRQLVDEGCDIEPVLTGRIDGIGRCLRMADAIREGDADIIQILIDETKADAEEEERRIREHMNQ